MRRETYSCAAQLCSIICRTVTDTYVRLMDIGTGRWYSDTVTHIEGSGLSRYEAW